MANMGPTILRIAMQCHSLRHRRDSLYIEGSRNRWKDTVPQRREEAMLTPPRLVLRPMPTVRAMPTLRPRGTLRLILKKLQIHNNHPMPLHATTFRPLSIRTICVPNNDPATQCPSISRPFQYHPFTAFPSFKPTTYSCPNTTHVVDHRCTERRLGGSPSPSKCTFSG